MRVFTIDGNNSFPNRAGRCRCEGCTGGDVRNHELSGQNFWLPTEFGTWVGNAVEKQRRIRGPVNGRVGSEWKIRINGGKPARLPDYEAGREDII